MKGSLLIILLISLMVLTMCSGSSGKNDDAADEAYHNKMFNVLERSKQVALDSKIKSIRSAMDSYYADHNEYPDLLDVLVPNYLPTTEPLTDPWGKPFKIETDDEMNLVLTSAGQDRTFGNQDDIKRRI